MFRRFFSSASLKTALFPPPSCPEDMAKVAKALSETLKSSSDRDSLLVRRATRLLWSYEFCVPMTKRDNKLGAFISSSSAGEELRVFTTEAGLTSKIVVPESEKQAFFAARATPHEVIKMMNQLKSASVKFLSVDDELRFDWERAGGRIETIVESASFVQQLMASESEEHENAALRALLKSELRLLAGKHEEKDTVLLDTIDGKVAFFLADDMAMEVCRGSVFAVPVSGLKNVVDDVGACAIVFDAKDGNANRYMTVDAERLKRLQ